MTLIGYWPLNENSGNTAYDHSGNENHGSLNNINKGVSGPLGQKCFSFNGSSSYISTNFSVDQTGSTSYTLCAWAKTDDTSGTTRQIVSSDNGGYDWSILQSKENLEWELFTGEGVLSSGISLDTNWHHIVGVFDIDKNETRLFVDGELTATGLVDKDTSNNEIFIGENPGNMNETWNGKISEVRIYDRPIIKSEVQYLYNVGKRGLQTTSKKSS